MEQSTESLRHLWEISNEMREVPKHGWMRKLPTGMSWGRCSCGLRIEGFNGQPLPESTVTEQLREHLDDAGTMDPEQRP